MNKGLRLKIKIVFALVFLIGINALTIGQGRHRKNDKTKKLTKEILAVYKSKGEKGLRQFVKANKRKINHHFIINFIDYASQANRGLSHEEYGKELGKKTAAIYGPMGQAQSKSKNMALIYRAARKGRKALIDVLKPELQLKIIMEMKDEILEVFDEEGEAGLRQLLKHKTQEITVQLFKEMMPDKEQIKKMRDKHAKLHRNYMGNYFKPMQSNLLKIDDWTAIAKIMAKEKNDKKALKRIPAIVKQYYTAKNRKKSLSEKRRQSKTIKPSKTKKKKQSTTSQNITKRSKKFYRQRFEQLRHGSLMLNQFNNTRINRNKKPYKTKQPSQQKTYTLPFTVSKPKKTKFDSNPAALKRKRVKNKWRLKKDYYERNGRIVFRGYTRSASRTPRREDPWVLKRMKQEVLDVYNDKGANGVRQFVKDKLLSRKFILNFADIDFDLGIYQWQIISNIMLRESKEKIVMSDRYSKRGLNNFKKQQRLVNHQRQLKEKILKTFASRGKNGVIGFVKQNRKKITHQFVMDFINSGFKERREDMVYIAEIMAKASGSSRTYYDVKVKVSQARDNFNSAPPKKDFSSRNKKTLKEEILTIYHSKGESCLFNFMKNLDKKIDPQFLKDFVESDYWETKKAWLSISKIMAEDKNDRDIMDDVFFRIQTYDDFNTLLHKTSALLKNRGEQWGIISSKPTLDMLNFEDAAQQAFERARYGLVGQKKRCAQMVPMQHINYIIESFSRNMPASDEKSTFIKEFNDCYNQMEKNEWTSTAKFYLNFTEYFKRKLKPSVKKKIFMKVLYIFFEQILLININNHNYGTGFANAEILRSRNFRLKMADVEEKVHFNMKPNLKRKQDYFLSKLSKLQSKIFQSKREMNENKLKELKAQLHKLRQQYKTFRIKNVPKYRIGPAKKADAISALDIQMLLKPDELVLSFFIISNEILVFPISNRNIRRPIKLETKEKEIDKTINRYLIANENRDTTRSIKYGKELYQKLFKPLEKTFKNRTNLIIVPDGNLAKVSFEAFVIDDKLSSKPVYLIEKYRINYIQSISILSIIRNPSGLPYKDFITSVEQAREKYRTDANFRLEVRKGKIIINDYSSQGKNKTRDKPKKNRFIGFGDPVYDYKNFKEGRTEKRMESLQKGKTRRSDDFGRLEASGEEVKSIAQVFKKISQQPPVIHLREKATEKHAKSANLRNFDYIHFACHGIVDNEFQSLVLSLESGTKEDGFLTYTDLENCYYNAKLVVLSACKTGTGKVERSEGITSLTRAVMIAGTPAVVASLWSVDDIATKELMVRFYKNILEKGMSNQRALRSAKLEMINSERYSSPCFWSAFVMYGE